MTTHANAGQSPATPSVRPFDRETSARILDSIITAIEACRDGLRDEGGDLTPIAQKLTYALADLDRAIESMALAGATPNRPIAPVPLVESWDDSAVSRRILNGAISTLTQARDTFGQTDSAGTRALVVAAIAKHLGPLVEAGQRLGASPEAVAVFLPDIDRLCTLATEAYDYCCTEIKNAKLASDMSRIQQAAIALAMSRKEGADNFHLGERIEQLASQLVALQHAALPALAAVVVTCDESIPPEEHCRAIVSRLTLALEASGYPVPPALLDSNHDLHGAMGIQAIGIGGPLLASTGKICDREGWRS